MVAAKLSGKVIQNINSTFIGGGVAEILSRMVPLLGQLGVDARWNVIKGNDEFFQVTKKFHNVLHGHPDTVSPEEFDTFMETSQQNINEMNTDSDIVFIHDPQPIALIKKRAGNKWLWRCHIDVSKPHKEVWAFLKNFIDQYDSAVFSALCPL